MIAAAALLAGTARPAAAQGGLLLQGIADVEGWATDTLSALLTRHGGRPAALGRLTLWTAAEPVRNLFVFGQVEIEGGPARAEGNSVEAYFDQFGVRWTPAPWFVADVGRLPHPVGFFAARRFSNRNPLIGRPDGYPTVYPEGAQVSGAASGFDWRVALVNLPLSHEDYVPDPTRSWRPALGGGVTLATGIRIGASGTWGPYLNRAFDPSVLAGKAWSAYRQRIVALDAQVSRGYVELRGEWARGSYEVPGAADAVAGETWYAEAKVTLTPRWFVAGRLERNDYPFVALFGPSWTATTTAFEDLELGVGYRVSSSLLAKASWRGDRWHLAPYLVGVLGPGGHALAVQLSQSFDVMDWLDRP